MALPPRSNRSRPHSWPACTSTFLAGAAAAAAALLLPACQSPLQQTSEAELRAALDRAMARETGSPPRRDVTLTAPPSRLTGRFSPERLAQLETMAGPVANRAGERTIEFGDNLSGLPTQSIPVNLREAVTTAVENNLQGQISAINPAVREADVVRAEARFDAVFFSGVEMNKIDAPATTSLLSTGDPLTEPFNQREDRSLSTGIRKPLITGGSLSLSTTSTRVDDESSTRRIEPDPSYVSSVELGLRQPLLRGFGSENNLSEIRLNRNAHRREIEDYRLTLLNIVNDTEAAYWNLYAARQALLVRQRLLQRGEETQNRLITREEHEYDVQPAQVSDAISRVQTRDVDVVQARNALLQASDELKRLMNAEGLSVGDETVVTTVDEPVGEPVTFSYADALSAALQNRPEIRQALLAIDDASIRQMLAENLKLPLLDLSATVRWNGLAASWEESYDSVGDQEFIDYLVGLRLEFPIGNREALASYRAARLRRIQSLLAYEQAIQNVTADVKRALRNLTTNFVLLSRTRDARIAAAESLRTIEVEEELTAALTPEFLNLKFQRQETLATAELEEISAQTNYQIALANLYLAMGLGLERNRIEFVVPNPEE